jgi:hypothetical protein
MLPLDGWVGACTVQAALNDTGIDGTGVPAASVIATWKMSRGVTMVRSVVVVVKFTEAVTRQLCPDGAELDTVAAPLTLALLN